VAQEFLDRPDVMALFEQVGRERVAKRVAADTFGDTRAKAGRLHRALEYRLVKMVASVAPVAWSPTVEYLNRAPEQTVTIEPPQVLGTIG